MTTITEKPLVVQDPMTKDWSLVPAPRRILAEQPRPVRFEPENKAHRAAFANFLINKKWPEGVRFLEEWPHTSAVTTIQTKLTEYALRKEIAAVRATSMALKKASL